jgi:hypothetical protein
MLTNFFRSMGRAALLVPVIPLMSGCFGGSDVAELADVSGTVTLDGKPLTQASVTFLPVTDEGTESRPASGVTDEHGQYELQYSTTQAGARPGAYQVSISTFREPGEDWSGNEVPGAPETVPSVYNSATTLTAEVKVDGPPIDFELKSDAGPVVQPPTDDEGTMEAEDTGC